MNSKIWIKAETQVAIQSMWKKEKDLNVPNHFYPPNYHLLDFHLPDIHPPTDLEGTKVDIDIDKLGSKG